MFTRDDLLIRRSRWLRDSASLIKVTAFDFDDFKAPAAKQSVRFYSAPREGFAHAADFWLASLTRLVNEFEPTRQSELESLIDRSLCRSSNPPAFIRFFEGCAGALVDPSRLAEPSELNDALEMLDAWNKQAFIAATACSFFAIWWATSA